MDWFPPCADGGIEVIQTTVFAVNYDNDMVVVCLIQLVTSIPLALQVL
jgi:hypothetical protein